MAYNANDLNFLAAFCHLNEKSESLFPIKFKLKNVKPKPASQHLHTRGLQTFAALSLFVFHGVAFLQLATFNFVDVNKQILATTFGFNETETFLIEKTSNFTFSHNLILLVN